MKPGASVLILTGFPVRPWISPAIGETDGPPGAAALAWAVVRGFRAVPVGVAPDPMLGQIGAAFKAGGLFVTDLDGARRGVEGPREAAVAVLRPFTRERRMAQACAQALLDELSPAAVIAIEHPGANHLGIYHGGVGHDISEACAKAEPLFALARERDILTLSIADMPNEIGLGLIGAEVRHRVPYADRCQCPCQGGTTAQSLVDVLVMATTANWGAYAVVAALSVVLGRADLRFTRRRDERAIAAVLRAGAVDGRSGSTDPAVGLDGVPTDLSGHMVELLNAVAENWGRPVK